MNIISAHSPQWADAAQTHINLMVQFAEIAGEVPFTASLSDIEPWGVTLYNNAIALQYGAIAPFPAMTLADAKTKQIAILNAACQAQIYAGFDSSALGAVYHYPAKDRDQSNLAASVIASLYSGLPTGWTTPFWCADGNGVWSLRPHTAAQIQQVGADGKTAILSGITKNANLAAQVAAVTTTVAAVQAIVW